MAVPFGRSLRSLRADGFRYTLIALAVASLLLIAWSLWFFNATITTRVSSSDARRVDSDIIEARFSTEPLRRISRGQAALFYPDADSGGADDSGAATAYPAVVSAVGSADGANGGLVTFVLRRPAQPQQRLRPLADGATGRVAVVIAAQTPARLVLQAASGSDTH